MRLILQEGFWVVHLPFVRRIVFQFLAQFPVVHHSSPVMSPSPRSIIYLFIYFTHSFFTLGLAGNLSPEPQGSRWSRFFPDFLLIQSFCLSLLGTDSSAPFIVIYMFHCFLSSLACLGRGFSFRFIFVFYYFTPWEFFVPVLADGLPPVFEWQQVSSSIQDSSQ